MPRHLSLWFACAALLWLPPLHAIPARNPANTAEIERMAGPSARALLLFFVASDCPISNRFMPEMSRIAAEFAPQHVATWYVYPNPAETLQAVREHQRAFGVNAESVTLDANGMLVRVSSANTTPEAALLTRDGRRWKVAYVGRIDDRYVHFGVERAQPTQHDLEDAVRAALAGKAVPAAGGAPVGCSIVPKGLQAGAAK